MPPAQDPQVHKMATFPALLARNNHSNPEEKPVNPPNSPVSPLKDTAPRKQHVDPMDKVLSNLQVRHMPIALTHAPPPPPSKPANDDDIAEDPILPSSTPFPVPFQWTSVAIGWYNALIWSRIYLQEGEAFQGPNGLYSATEIRLFRRHSAKEEVSLRNPKGAIDAVGNSLAMRIGSLSSVTLGSTAKENNNSNANNK